MILIGHINVNSIRNKFDFFTRFTKNEVDILKISEPKLDSSFSILHERFFKDI